VRSLIGGGMRGVPNCTGIERVVWSAANGRYHRESCHALWSRERVV
jgi:hypothetical protein